MEGVPARCVRLTRFFYTEAERPDHLLCNQLQKAADLVDNLVVRPLFDFQRDALLCLLSDLMAGYSRASVVWPNSFMLKCLNRGMFQIAAGEFPNFSLLNGKINPRAWEKRRAEQFLFATGRMLF